MYDFGHPGGWDPYYPGAAQQPGFGYPGYPGTPGVPGYPTYPGYPGYPYPQPQPPFPGEGLPQRVARLERQMSMIEPEVDRLLRRVAEIERRLGIPGPRSTPEPGSKPAP